MITMSSPYFVWINTNEKISSWCLLGAVCVTPPGGLEFAEFEGLRHPPPDPLHGVSNGPLFYYWNRLLCNLLPC
jgi:hypothetical protein